MAYTVADERVAFHYKSPDGTVVEEIIGDSVADYTDAQGRVSAMMTRSRYLRINKPGQQPIIRDSLSLPKVDFPERTMLAYGEVDAFYVVVYHDGTDTYIKAIPLDPALNAQHVAIFPTRLKGRIEQATIAAGQQTLMVTCKPDVQRVLCAIDPGSNQITMWKPVK